MSNAVDNREVRMLDAAHRYALSEKSDPFALARCLTHHRLGLDRPNKHGEDCHYDADAYQEARMLPSSDEHREAERTYHVTSYRHVKKV